MFDKTLKENADETFQMAEKALKKVVDGEVTYQNLRNYVINLHNSYELYFKYKLLEKNEFMLFSFKNFDKVIKKYENSFKKKQTLTEYVESSGGKLPNTVSFTEAIERLAYLYKEEEFTLEFIDDLYKLNDFRNNLTHFRYRLGDEEFMAVSKLFIKYSRKYSEHRWGSLPWEEKLDLKEFEEEVKSKEIGDKKLECNTREYKIKRFKFDCKNVAEHLVTHGEEFSRDELEKLENRLEVLKYARLIDFTEDIIEKGEGKFTTIVNVKVRDAK